MKSNLLADLPAALPDELVQSLVENSSVKIERIVSWGQSSPPNFWYDQPWSEWVLLLAGQARLHIAGRGLIELRAGDCLEIAAHQRHRVDWTTPDEPTVWLAVHYP